VGDFDTVEKDTVLIYESTGFSRYDGYIGFFFSDAEGKKKRWDIRDDMNPAIEAKKVFAPASKKQPNQPPEPMSGLAPGHGSPADVRR
jgi:hypothetical protein